MYKISFIYEENLVEFKNTNLKDLYTSSLDWLNKNGYTFKGDVHSTFNRRIHNIDEIRKMIGVYQMSHFYNIDNSGKYILYNDISVNKILPNILKMLKNFGIDESVIKTNGFETKTKIKKFGEIENINIQNDKIENSEIKIFSKNPFRQAICVLGGSGAGKSTTIENILDEEGHEFEFIIPSASTTGLLSQFSPSKSGYVPSKLGKMILNAYENPRQLFTAVFDECHKSNVIEMINDELLQAISIKRNAGNRFISLDDDTAELYPGTEKHRGNILMPDNLGFIFISSKPDVIIHNDDFFNRIDIVQLKSYEEERLTNIEELLSKTLSNEEKESLKSNND